MADVADQAKPWIETPMIESAPLSKAAGCRVFLKLENLQPAGSFKSRGIGNLILKSQPPPGQAVHYYSSSGGNAGLAAVTAAQTLGHPCSVVVPTGTKPAMIAMIKAAGAAAVIQAGASWYEADSHLREEILAKDSSGVYVPPWDHPDIWSGHATLVHEVKHQMPQGEEPDAIVVSVGGGGLLCGVVQGVEEAYDSKTTVLAVETVGCDSLNQAVKAGSLVSLPKISSLATSLGALQVGDQTLKCGQQSNVRSLTVTDAEAAMGCWRFADDQRMLVELACGASIALAYTGRLCELVPNFSQSTKVLFVVCGGANISLEQLAEYKEMFSAEAEKYATQDRAVPSTHTVPALA